MKNSEIAQEVIKAVFAYGIGALFIIASAAVGVFGVSHLQLTANEAIDLAAILGAFGVISIGLDILRQYLLIKKNHVEKMATINKSTVKDDMPNIQVTPIAQAKTVVLPNSNNGNVDNKIISFD